MNTFELQSHISRFLSELETFKPFTETVSALSVHAEGLEAFVRIISTGGTVGISDGGSRACNHLGQTKQKIAGQHTQRSFYKALEHFQRIVTELQLPNCNNSGLIGSMIPEIDSFAMKYDSFISNQSGQDATSLVFAAIKLHAKLQVLMGSLQFFSESSGFNDIPNRSESLLSLWLPSQLKLSDFANRLAALQSIYSELCMLFSISETDYPLRISKIESGSLWAKLFGETKVIECMILSLGKVSAWMYRSFTTEGKIASIPQKVEVIDSLLELTQQLEKAGINTSEMKEHIGKSAVVLSKNLATLLDGQPSITINGNTISIGSEVNRAMLEQLAPLLLEDQEAIDCSPSAALPPPQ